MDLTELQIEIPQAQIDRRVARIADQINKDFQGRSIVLIGVLKGAFIFLADLSRRLQVDLEIDLLWLSSYKSGTKPDGPVRVIKDLDADIKNRDVIVVEDVVDSGQTMQFIRRHLMAKNPRSLKVCALLDKRQKHDDLMPDYVGFTMDDNFIVGYGLDLDERYRQLPNIYRLIKE